MANYIFSILCIPSTAFSHALRQFTLKCITFLFNMAPLESECVRCVLGNREDAAHWRVSAACSGATVLGGIHARHGTLRYDPGSRILTLSHPCIHTGLLFEFTIPFLAALSNCIRYSNEGRAVPSHDTTVRKSEQHCCLADH